ncbi:MAG: tetratricopeptide repeat protein [Synechococcales bacterium]|nr:tetratricopeptide repeat protein [Synechococcales bacterium]
MTSSTSQGTNKIDVSREVVKSSGLAKARELSKKAKDLAKVGKLEEAIALFDKALVIYPNNAEVIADYAKAMRDAGQHSKAGELFEKCLELEPNSIKNALSYIKSLNHQKNFTRVFELFEHCLKLEPNSAMLMSGYGRTSAMAGEYEKANKFFEYALQLDGNNIPTLNSYANALAQQGEYQRANELFEHCLKLDENDARTLNSYTNVLVQSCSWQRLIELRSDNSYARLQYAQQLEAKNELKEALMQLLAIDLATQQIYHANIIRLNLGRLYYRLGQIDRGKQFFEEAIANSDEQDKTILYAARSLLATNPNSQEAINLLFKIQEDSPRYAEAMKAIALNADEETSYELFGAEEEQIDDIEMLYRAMYHKIGNEIAVLRSISYRLLKRMEGEHPLVKEIVHDLEKLQQGIASQRANEKAAIAQVSHSNYKQLIEIVSKTAHDISDEVNNQLAVIESKTRRAMRKLTAENPHYQQFDKFLLQLKITQKAINDLKSINEGKTIRRNRFLVHQLFEKWEPENWTSQPRIDGVRIRLDIRNPDSEFNGDEEKIKSILNELVENSLKHNHGNPNLSIHMYSSDIDNPMDVGSPTIPGDRKFLYIEFKDNGQGIPNDKKDWIFQPLKTTSPEDKGSGLGLFIARKTIKKMGGQMREVGEAGKGVRFQIFLPYL